MYKVIVSTFLFLFATFANALIIQDSRQIVFDWNEDVSTIYSLDIQGKLFDVSFNQAFGTPDVKSLGLHDPIEALFTILEFTNNTWIYETGTPYNLSFKFPFATFSNGLGGRTIYVQNDNETFYRGDYSAGWIWSEVSKAEPQGLVYFRHAVPNAFLTTVPEPSSYSFLFVGIFFILIVIKSNKIQH